MDAKIFSPGQPIMEMLSAEKTTGSNSEKGKLHFFHLHNTCIYTFVPKHVLCAFKGINQRSRSMYSYHLTPDVFLTPISEIMGRYIFLRG